MSVEIKVREPFKGMGRVIVSSQEDALNWEDIRNRVDSIIEAIYVMQEEFRTSDVIQPMLEMLKDYLPTDEQWKKIFED